MDADSVFDAWLSVMPEVEEPGLREMEAIAIGIGAVMNASV